MYKSISTPPSVYASDFNELNGIKLLYTNSNGVQLTKNGKLINGDDKIDTADIFLFRDLDKDSKLFCVNSLERSITLIKDDYFESVIDVESMYLCEVRGQVIKKLLKLGNREYKHIIGNDIIIEESGIYQIFTKGIKNKIYNLDIECNLDNEGILRIEPTPIVARGSVELLEKEIESDTIIKYQGELDAKGKLNSNAKFTTLDTEVDIEGDAEVEGNVELNGKVDINGEAEISLGGTGSSIEVKGNGLVNDNVNTSGSINAKGKVFVPSTEIGTENVEIELEGKVPFNGEANAKGIINFDNSRLKAQGIITLEDCKVDVKSETELNIKGNVELPESINIYVNEDLVSNYPTMLELKSGDIISSNYELIIKRV